MNVRISLKSKVLVPFVESSGPKNGFFMGFLLNFSEVIIQIEPINILKIRRHDYVLKMGSVYFSANGQIKNSVIVKNFTLYCAIMSHGKW